MSGSISPVPSTDKDGSDGLSSPLHRTLCVTSPPPAYGPGEGQTDGETHSKRTLSWLTRKSPVCRTPFNVPGPTLGIFEEKENETDLSDDDGDENVRFPDNTPLSVSTQRSVASLGSFTSASLASPDIDGSQPDIGSFGACKPSRASFVASLYPQRRTSRADTEEILNGDFAGSDSDCDAAGERFGCVSDLPVSPPPAPVPIVNPASAFLGSQSPAGTAACLKRSRFDVSPARPNDDVSPKLNDINLRIDTSVCGSPDSRRYASTGGKEPNDGFSNNQPWKSPEESSPGPRLLPSCGFQDELRCIEPKTLVRLLNGEFSDTVASIEVVDCRFNYEYEGGHIQSAVSVNTPEALQERFFTAGKLRECSALPNAAAHRGHKFVMSSGVPAVDGVPVRDKHVVVVFHCEFSQSRGPKMMRAFRELDRRLNVYPQLHYPEVYLLYKGFKNFFAEYPELCGGYVPMDHPEFTAECAAAMARHTMEKRKRQRPSRLTRAVSVTFCRRDDEEEDMLDFASPRGRSHSSMALQFKLGSPPSCDGRSGTRPSNRTLDFLVPPHPCVSPDNELVLGCDATLDSLASPPLLPLAAAFEPSSPSIPFHRAYSATATFGHTSSSLLGSDAVMLHPMGVELPRPAPAPAPASSGLATAPHTTVHPPQLPQYSGVRRGSLFGRE